MNSPTVPRIFDRQQLAAKMDRARARQRQDQGTHFLLDTMVEDVIERLGFMQLEPSRALVVGDERGDLLRHLDQSGAQCAEGAIGHFDEEQPATTHFDLIVHLIGLGMVNDLPGALIHARMALAEEGLFIAAFPGSGSMPALRRIALAADGDKPSARMHPLVDLRGATGLMERAGFRRQVVDSYPLRVRYSSLARMISDLRDHGLTRSLSTPAPPVTRDWLVRAEAEFDILREGEDRKVVETFEILVLTGWR